MKPIYILGCGGLAKEVYMHIMDTNMYEIKAFIDLHNQQPILLFNKSVPVISEDDFMNIDKSNICLAVGIGDPLIIKKVVEKFIDYNFPNIIHPSAICNQMTVNLGRGNIITPGVIFTVNIKVGNFNIFNLSTTVGHDVIIGDGNVINPTVNISGSVTIGDYNLLGVGSTILQFKTVGNFSVIGASSLVTKDIADRSLVMGVPAKAVTYCKPCK